MGQEVVRIAPLRLRYTYPPEMEALLNANGLAVRERYGGYDFSPLTEASEHQLYVCEAVQAIHPPADIDV